MNKPGGCDDGRQAELAALAAELEALQPGWIEKELHLIHGLLARSKMRPPRRIESRP